jgi:hypothetical protein
MPAVRIGLIVCLLAGTLSPAAAVRPITPPAPEFPRNSAWVNSMPYSMARFKGRRVVMVTFINLYSINSVRTVRWLNSMWDKYALKGLMIVGVHSPDFSFDRDPARIREAVTRFGLRFPVVIDSDKKIWNSYNNSGWPAHYLVSHKGLLLHDRVGEGGYGEFEHEVLLALENNGARFPKDYYIKPDKPRKECGSSTEGFHLGTERGPELKKLKAKRVEAIVEARDGEVRVLGKWSKEKQAVRFKGDSRRLNTRMRLIYHGAEALAVLSRTGTRPGRLYVKQDNLWLHAGNANTDIQWDDDDRSYVLVDQPRLYHLTRNLKRRMYELLLLPDEEGVGLDAFEFSDHCQTEYDHK